MIALSFLPYFLLVSKIKKRGKYMWTTGYAALYSLDGKMIEERTGTITNVVNYGNGVTTFNHDGDKVIFRNGIISITESHRYKLDGESDLDYPP